MDARLVSLVALVIAAAGLFLSHFKTKGSVELSDRVTKLETKIEPFWLLVESNMAKILHRPTHEEMDALLEKRENMEPLTPDESNKLEKMLQELIDDSNESRDLRTAATLMLASRVARRHGIKH